MFTNEELAVIGVWAKTKFVGEFYFSFVKGFESRYIIVERERDCQEGRRVFKIEEILKGED